MTRRRRRQRVRARVRRAAALGAYPRPTFPPVGVCTSGWEEAWAEDANPPLVAGRDTWATGGVA